MVLFVAVNLFTGTRERILILSRRREKSRFFVKTAIWPPLQGLWASISCPSVPSCLAFDALGFLRTGFLTLIAFDKKECRPNADWDETFWPGENTLHTEYETIWFFDRSRSLVSRSFYSGPSVACLVMRDDVLLFIHSWDKMIYSVHEHDFESPWLSDVTLGTAIFFIRRWLDFDRI